jgi:hypothetical protein
MTLTKENFSSSPFNLPGKKEIRKIKIHFAVYG